MPATSILLELNISPKGTLERDFYEGGGTPIVVVTQEPQTFRFVATCFRNLRLECLILSRVTIRLARRE